jgi:prepilin-type N-terminal cleavage/methylation domain-containing protein
VKFKSKKGFSLLELMVAIGILSVGMAGVGAMLFQSFQSDRYNTKEKRAHAAASQIAERFRAGNPKSDPGTLPNEFLKLPNQGNGLLVGRAGGMSLFWQDTIATTNTYWPDSTITDAQGTFFCSWSTYSPSTYGTGGSLSNTDPPAEGSITQILIGWGSGANCSRTSVDQCPRIQRIVVMRDNNVEKQNK